MPTSIYLIANQSVELPDLPRGGPFITKEWTEQVLGIIKSLNKPPETILNMLTEVKRGYYKYISAYIVKYCFVCKSINVAKMVNPAILENQSARVYNKLFRPLNNSQLYDSDLSLLHDINNYEVWQPLGNEDITDEFSATSVFVDNKVNINLAVKDCMYLIGELNTVRDSLMELGSVARRAA